MTEENKYIAQYQAILDRNATKAVILDSLNDKEEKSYPNEYPELDYDEIFGNKNPHEFLEGLLKSTEYEFFYSLFIEEKKSLLGKYLIASYQAIIEKNTSKCIKFHKLNSKEKINYPDEYPELNYDEIFKNKDPDDIIKDLLDSKEYQDLVYALLPDILKEGKDWVTRELSHSELINHPLIDYCPKDRSSIIDNLLSISYSTVITKEEVTYKLGKLLNQSSIIDGVLSVIAFSTTIESDTPLSLALINDEMAEYNPLRKNSGGYYSPSNNRLVVTNKDLELNVGFVTHELAHKAMDIFDNNSKPFNEFSEAKYHNAIKATLLNIHQFIQQDFGLKITFEDQNNTWKMGKDLSSMLFPQYLEGNNIEKFILSFKNHNLNLNDQFPWLKGNSLLSKVMSYGKFEIADKLVEAGANIPFIPNYMTHPDILNWFIHNNKKIDLDYVDCDNKTVLDYADGDHDLIHKLISNADVYPPNYSPICVVNYECPKGEYNTIEIIDQLSALEILLNFYNQNSSYNPESEDAEFIVRLPQIIAEGLYKGKIVEILEPLAEYWHEVISPAATEYISKHDSASFESIYCQDNIIDYTCEANL